MRQGLYQQLKGLHAGLCLATILLLPAFNSNFPNPQPVAPGIDYTYQQRAGPFELGIAYGNVSYLIPLSKMLDMYGEMNKKSFNMKYNQSNDYLYTVSRGSYIDYSQTDVFRFVGWYSEFSMPINVILQILGTIAVVGSFDLSLPLPSAFSQFKFKLIDTRTFIRFIYTSCTSH